MNPLFAQVDPNKVIDAGKEVISRGAEFGPEMFLLMFCLVTAIAFAALWMWKVILPTNKVHRQCFETLGEAVKAFSMGLPEINDVAKESHSSIRRVEQMVSIQNKCHEANLSVVAKVAQHNNLDLGMELGEIRGVIRAASNPP